MSHTRLHASAKADDYINSAGSAAIGARLRRLSERIDRECNALYRAYGVEDFEQRWFGVLNQLDISQPLSVGDIAVRLGITHVSVSQTRASLERAGLINFVKDPEDGRRRQLSLSAAGKKLVKRLRPLWDAMSLAAVELDEVARLVEPLRRLETALQEKSLFERTQARLAGINVGAANT